MEPSFLKFYCRSRNFAILRNSRRVLINVTILVCHTWKNLDELSSGPLREFRGPGECGEKRPRASEASIKFSGSRN